MIKENTHFPGQINGNKTDYPKPWAAFYYNGYINTDFFLEILILRGVLKFLLGTILWWLGSSVQAVGSKWFHEISYVPFQGPSGSLFFSYINVIG